MTGKYDYRQRKPKQVQGLRMQTPFFHIHFGRSLFNGNTTYNELSALLSAYTTKNIGIS